MENLSIKQLMQIVEQSMVKTANAYAKKNEMVAATAIHDAYLCLEKELKELEVK